MITTVSCACVRGEAVARELQEYSIMSKLGGSTPRVVILERDNELAELIALASRDARASSIERTGTTENALKLIVSSRANALIGTVDLEASESREFVAILRDPRRTPARHIVVVALSGPLARDQAVRVIRAGIDQIVVPPHNVARIAERLRFAFRRPALAISTASYVGPCRRRAPDRVYDGPNRRASESNPEAALAE
jgi:DNA-binding response OmpR family regulator